MSPHHVLKAVEEVYCTCSTYRDSGQHLARFISQENGEHSEVKPFITSFARPNKLRFEFRDQLIGGWLTQFGVAEKWRRYIIAFENDLIRSWWDIDPGVKNRDSLTESLRGASGVSSSLSTTIPALLRPDLDLGRLVTNFHEIDSFASEELDGVKCYRIQGRYHNLQQQEKEPDLDQPISMRMPRPFATPQYNPTTLWIDQNTTLIRRIEYSTSYDTFKKIACINFSPAINVAISESEFALNFLGL